MPLLHNITSRLAISSLPNSEERAPYKAIIWFIIVAGMAIRLYHFFYNRSLWEDEIYLSAGIANRSLSQILTQPLPYLQKAPLGYLLISRLFVAIFGANEMGLRLYPLLCGMASLVLFLPVARHWLKPLGVITATALMAFAPPLVYHSVEAKPYITELLATVILIRLYIQYKNDIRWKQLLIWGIWGAVLIWFAYTALFVLAATAMAAAAGYLYRKNTAAVFKLLLPGTVWLVSFAISYVLYAKEGSQSGWLVDFWQKHEGYIPLAPKPAMIWLLHRVFSFLHYPMGLSWRNDWAVTGVLQQMISRMVFVALLFVGAGIVYFYKSNKQYLVLLAAALLVAIVASAMKVYPFHERLTVYLAPFVILLIGGGADVVQGTNQLVKGMRYVLVAALLFGPIKNTILQLVHPGLFGDYKKSYQREALQYVDQHYQKGECVYIYHNNLPGYEFYKAINPGHYPVTIGGDYRNQTHDFAGYFNRIDNELRALGYKRIWVVYQVLDMKVGEYVDTPAWYYQNHDGVDRFGQHLLQIGRKLDEYKPADGAAVSNVKAVLIELK